MNDYLFGTSLIGADVTYGPPSPEDLAKLDRKLTPAEQKAVDDWQSKDADNQEKAAIASGAPAVDYQPGGTPTAKKKKAKTAVAVGPKGAPESSAVGPKGAPESSAVGPKGAPESSQMPLWQILLGVAGAVVTGTAVYVVVRR